MQDEKQLLAYHGALRPDGIAREYAEFFYREALEGGLDVFGIDVLAFFGDDHVFLAAEDLQMALGGEAAEVAGHEPAVDHGFLGEVVLVEVARHYGFAAHEDFADAIRIGIDDADFHAGKRFADGVCTEGL